MTQKNHDEATPQARVEDHDKNAEVAKPTPKAEVKANVTPSGTPFPFTASINEPQTVSLPVPDNVVVPKPSISSLSPDECAIGDDDFTLDVIGENFFADSVIHFAGHDEPTTYNAEEKTLSTGIKPSLWAEPVVVQCQVKNGGVLSDPVDFTFLAAGAARSVDPDELEEELDEAEDDGDFKSTHKPKVKPKAKR